MVITSIYGTIPPISRVLIPMETHLFSAIYSNHPMTSTLVPLDIERIYGNPIPRCGHFPLFMWPFFTWATKKNVRDIPLYRLLNRDPHKDILWSLYNWQVFHPPKNSRSPRFLSLLTWCRLTIPSHSARFGDIPASSQSIFHGKWAPSPLTSRKNAIWKGVFAGHVQSPCQETTY